jgi:hypothetical protein
MDTKALAFWRDVFRIYLLPSTHFDSWKFGLMLRTVGSDTTHVHGNSAQRLVQRATLFIVT